MPCATWAAKLSANCTFGDDGAWLAGKEPELSGDALLILRFVPGSRKLKGSIAPFHTISLPEAAVYSHSCIQEPMASVRTQESSL
jgi:hypothetical protein